MLVEPGGEALIVPQSEVLAAVGKVEGRNPVGMGLQDGRPEVEMVGHVVEDDIHAAGMGRIEQLAELVGRAETVVELRGVDGPVAMVTRKTGERLLVESPGVARVLCDGRNPERRDAERIEETGLDPVGDAAQVAALVVDLRQHVGPAEGRIVGRIAVVETVDHQRIEHLRLPVAAVEPCGIGDGTPLIEREEQVVEAGVVRNGEDPQPRTVRIGSIGGQQDLCPPVAYGDILVGQAAVLPQSHDLPRRLRSFHLYS